MRKKRISEQEYQEMMDEIMPHSRDHSKAAPLMQRLEEVLMQQPYLKPNAQLLILRGAILHNEGKGPEAEAMYDKAYTLALSNQEISWQAEALRLKGAMQSYRGALIAAEKTLKTAIELFASIHAKYNLASCLHSLSLIYNETGEFEKYLETSEEALLVLKNSGAGDDIYARAYVLTVSTRCTVLRRMRLNERAMSLIREVMKSGEFEMAGEFAQNNALMEYGQLLADAGDYEKSNATLIKYLDNVKGRPVDLSGATVNNIMAQNMIELEQWKEGEKHVVQAISYNRENQNNFYLSENLLVLALLLMGRHKTKAAQDCLREAEALMQESQSDYYLWQFNESYSYYHQKQKDYGEAFKHLQIANKYQAICLRADYDKKLKSIGERLQLSEKEKQNQLLQKDIEMKKQELSMASDFLNQKVELLKELKGFMKDMRKENIRKNEMMKALDRKIDTVINVEYEQQLFIEKIETSGNDFIVRLRKQYPQISLTEAKVCSLLRNNFSNKEIANLLVTSIRTVENHRYNIRKKIGVNGDSSLSQLLHEI